MRSKSGNFMNFNLKENGDRARHGWELNKYLYLYLPIPFPFYSCFSNNLRLQYSYEQ